MSTNPRTDDPLELMRRLLAARRPVAAVRRDDPGSIVPAVPGLYAFWSTKDGGLPAAAVPSPRSTDAASTDGGTLLYVGLAPKRAGNASNLRHRVRAMHVRGRTGSSTFRYALAALMWGDQRWTPRYPNDRAVLSKEHEAALSVWQDEHLEVGWCEHPTPWLVERAVIAAYGPPLNVRDNERHPFYRRLREARAAFVAEAKRNDVDLDPSGPDESADCGLAQPSAAVGEPTRRSAGGGHLFVTRGDLSRLACDAILVPSGWGPGHPGRRWHVGTRAWHGLLEDEIDSDAYVTLDPAKDPPGEDDRVALVRARRQETDGSQREPAVWVGHTGEAGRHPAWHAAAVGDFIRAATDALEGDPDGAWRPLDDPRPLLGVPLVGTGAGGAANRKDDAVLAVITAIQEAQARTGADVVLVLADDSALAAAQQARRGAATGDPFEALDRPLRDLAKRLGEDARDGALVPFVGAGAGLGAGLPSWSALLDDLAREAGFDEIERAELRRLDARDQAQILRQATAVPAVDGGPGVSLNDVVAARTNPDGQRVSLVHQLLATLPVSEVVTTNYDLCLEDAFTSAGRPLARLGSGADRRDGWLLKMHGSADDAPSIVLSREDYLRFEGDGVALAGVVQAMLLTRHLLFVGYSLSDDNFHRLVHQAAQVGAPSREGTKDERLRATALTPQPLGLAQEVWGGRVDFRSTADGDQMNARRQAILLDAVAAAAAPATAHLQDPSYANLFTKKERQVGASLGALETLVGTLDEDREQAVRSAIEAALRRLDGVGSRPTDTASARSGTRARS